MIRRAWHQGWITAVVAAVAFTGGFLSGLQTQGIIAGGIYMAGMGFIFIALIGAFVSDHNRQREYMDEERIKLRAYEKIDASLRAAIDRMPTYRIDRSPAE